MSSAVESPRYDQIGRGYARTRREDPRFREQIHAALGTARNVVNVGAGAGSYEPHDRIVVAIEPSDVMAGQRPPELSPAIRGDAAHLPLRDDSVDAAMAVLTVHHWNRDQQPGLKEMRRVARDAVVIVTYDPTVSGQMWLMADYLPEVAQLDREIFAAPDVIAGWLGGHTVVESMAIPHDTPDWMLGSFWAHPEGVLDEHACAATSGFARMGQAVVERVGSELERDLQGGEWDRRHGHLRRLDSYDAGLRLIVNTPTSDSA